MCTLSLTSKEFWVWTLMTHSWKGWKLWWDESILSCPNIFHEDREVEAVKSDSVDSIPLLNLGVEKFPGNTLDLVPYGNTLVEKSCSGVTLLAGGDWAEVDRGMGEEEVSRRLGMSDR
ncbi:hypothetical protein L210DRAFT_3500701 [Boletus edulis BED1]|uniref:Uncharacterized protein n=1 Tax=Boletus edulis BED1 TaxID=1328754 RepID=A0AAD4GKA4_BOLED|nr:hypothetical protein L210DRAFT_3500701 [Boletus edulis BED1]